MNFADVEQEEERVPPKEDHIVRTEPHVVVDLSILSPSRFCCVLVVTVSVCGVNY